MCINFWPVYGMGGEWAVRGVCGVRGGKPTIKSLLGLAVSPRSINYRLKRQLTDTTSISGPYISLYGAIYGAHYRSRDFCFLMVKWNELVRY